MSGVTKTGRRYDSRAASALMDGSIIHAAAIKVDSSIDDDSCYRQLDTHSISELLVVGKIKKKVPLFSLISCWY